MDTILVDTSVWINYLKNIDTKASNYIDREINGILIATCPVIVQEFLQGIASDGNFRSMEIYFDNLIQLVNDPYDLAIDAAKLYRSLRKKGITIRKPNDCLIAAYAMRNDILLLQDDRDFIYIAENSDLKLVEI